MKDYQFPTGTTAEKRAWWVEAFLGNKQTGVFENGPQYVETWSKYINSIDNQYILDLYKIADEVLRDERKSSNR